jgi:short-subunit dehydrogenase
MKSLDNQTVLITGAAGGFGQAMIRRFLEAGSNLIVTDVDDKKLKNAVDYVSSKYGLFIKGRILGCVKADLSDDEGCNILYQEVRGITPNIDILVNNAGINVGGVFSDIPQEKWERIVQINLLAPMRLIFKFLPSMIERRQGHIVNVASAAAFIGAPELTTYCATKFGLRGFGKSLATDINRYRIDVTTIYPLFSRTGISQSEHYGPEAGFGAPKLLLYSADFVVVELLKGIRKRKRHIYPGVRTKAVLWLQHVFPALVEAVLRKR